MIEITDDESLKKENITIDKSKDEFNNFYQKVNSLKDSIENEINKLNNLYDKIYEQITKSFEIKHEKLISFLLEFILEMYDKTFIIFFSLSFSKILTPLFIFSHILITPLDLDKKFSSFSFVCVTLFCSSSFNSFSCFINFSCFISNDFVICSYILSYI